MPFIRRPFGKREGVPPRDAAMAALGVDVKGSKGFKGDRGSKGSEDEIVLSAAELRNVERAEQIPEAWSKERVIEWVEKNGFTRRGLAEKWVSDHLILHPDGVIEVIPERITIKASNHEVPLPPYLHAKQINLQAAKITHLPVGIQAESLILAYSDIEEIPPGIQVKRMDLGGMRFLTDFPEDTGLLEEVYIQMHQNELIAAARRVGLRFKLYD